MIFRRFFAFLIDKFIIIIITGILGFFIDLAIRLFVQGADQIYFETVIIISAISIPFYFAYFESSKTQATLGKQLLDIKIIDMYGNSLDGTEAFIRFFAAFFINITIIGFIVSVIIMLVNEDGKMLHDIFLNTKVLRR